MVKWQIQYNFTFVKKDKFIKKAVYKSSNISTFIPAIFYAFIFAFILGWPGIYTDVDL